MSVTTTSRVDATAPVLAQLVDAAMRGFTGSLEVSSRDSTGRDLQLVVWLEDGSICAVHSPGWVPPAAEYVLHRTGYDFSQQAESPFKLAYETVVDGQPLLTAADLDAPRRDWAYGLLASSLTWPKPKFKRVKKVTSGTNRINPSPWQLVTADVAARVDGLESAWRVVCESLEAAGIRPVSAGRACAVMGVLIGGHPLFDGSECLDQVAGRSGLSRYTVLEELSRAILSGAVPQFTQAGAPAVQMAVPEFWEDPANAWGWVAEAPVQLVEAAVPVEPEVVPEPVDEQAAESELDMEPVLPEGYVEPELMVEPEPDEPEPATEPEPDTESEPVVEPELKITLAVEPDPTCARDLINGWLQGSTSERDAAVRGQIVSRLISGVKTAAQDRANDVARAADELDRADNEAHQSVDGVSAAIAALTTAQEALVQAEVEVARVQSEFAGVMRAARDATSRASARAAQLAAEEAASAELHEQATVQDGTVVSARQVAAQAAQVAEAAELEVAQTAAPALASARSVAQMVRTGTVAPAQDASDAAQQRSVAAAHAVSAASRSLEGSAAAAEDARIYASEFDFELATPSFAQALAA